MIIKNHGNYVLITTIFCIYLIASAIQSAFLLNWDVSWGIHVADKFLAGEKYVEDFFDINPPITSYLYAPTVLLMRIFHIKIMAALKIYIFILSSLSLALSYLSICNIFYKEEYFLRMIFISAIAFTLLILPQFHFGQREHLLLILTMPFILSIPSRLENCKINFFLAIFLGLLAGMGFVIKPQFLITFAILEFYYMYECKRLLSIFRPETITIISFILSYILLSFIFYPNYIHTIIPLATKYYYYGYGSSWSTLFTQPIILYFICVGAFLFFYYKKNHCKHLSIALFISAIGFMLSYFLQRTPWNYHYLPMLSILTLLVILLFGLYLYNGEFKNKNVASFFIGIILLSYPICFIIYNFHEGVTYKKLMNPLIEYMKKNTAGKTVFFLTINIDHPLPAIDYSNSILASHFAHPPILIGILKKLLSYPTKNYPSTLVADKNFLINMITNDLNNKKPEFVFIDTREFKDFINFRIDYLHFLSENPEFKKAWSNYQYIGTIKQPRSAEEFSRINCSFYLLHNPKDISKIDLNSEYPYCSLILTGETLHRVVYLYSKDKQFAPINFDLTDKEQQFFTGQNEGLFLINKENEKVLKSVRTRLFQQMYLFYQLAVYERRSTLVNKTSE